MPRFWGRDQNFRKFEGSEIGIFRKFLNPDFFRKFLKKKIGGPNFVNFRNCGGIASALSSAWQASRTEAPRPARAAAQPLRTQTAHSKHAQGDAKKNTSLADTEATHLGEEDIAVSANEDEEDNQANSDDNDFISHDQHDNTGLDQRLCEIDTMQEDSGSETELLEQAIQDISGKKCKKLSVEADETVKKKERSK